MKAALWQAAICALALALAACSQFREPIKLASGKTVDVVGLHWQVLVSTGQPTHHIYTITYVTKLPLNPDKLRPEADEVWRYYQPSVGAGYDIVVIEAITEPSGGFIKQYRSYRFMHERTTSGWREQD